MQEKSINALVIDDDPMAIMMVKGFCNQLGGVSIEHSYTNPFKGAAGIIIKRPDLVFLDIEMPEFSGLQILKHITNKPKFVVMSSERKFKKPAIKLKASAFLRKPILFKDFKKVVEKLKLEIEPQNA